MRVYNSALEPSAPYKGGTLCFDIQPHSASRYNRNFGKPYIDLACDWDIVYYALLSDDKRIGPPRNCNMVFSMFAKPTSNAVIRERVR